MSSDHSITTDQARFMARALELARCGEGRTTPNPPVGAVLVQDGTIVGEGYHPAAGEPHAEIFALQAAGPRARGADLYVTLEPCCHQGRTGPCCEALIAAGVRRVYYGIVDPNPRVAGQGIERLRAAGLDVAAGPLADECRWLIAPFAKHVSCGRPYVTLKAAMSLDAQLATAGGESQWISGPASRAEGQRRRNRADAVLTGAGTVLADNPRLTVRLPEGGRNPVRVVLDGQLRTTPEANVYSPLAAGRRLLVTAADSAASRLAPFVDLGVEIIAVPRCGAHLDLQAVMQSLGSLGIQSLLVEAGGGLNGALLRAGLVDRLLLFVAPLLFGGSDGVPLCSGSGVARLAEALRLQEMRISRLADDLLLEGEVARCSPD